MGLPLPRFAGLRLLACLWRLIEQSPAETDAISSVAVGEKAEVTHTVEAIRQYMQQETPDELVRIKAHDLLAFPAVATVILPSEGYVAVIDLDDAAVGDGDTMGVPTEIGQHLVRAAEWWLRVNDPFDAASTRDMAGEGLVVVEMTEFVGEAKFTVSEGSGKGVQKEPPKQARQHAHGQKEARPASDPP